MSHIVVHRFSERYHNNHIYEIGHDYPAKGKKATKARLKELSTKENKYGKVYIQPSAQDGE